MKKIHSSTLSKTIFVLSCILTGINSSLSFAHPFEVESQIELIIQKCEKNNKSERPDAELMKICLDVAKKNKLPREEGAIKATAFYGSSVHEDLTGQSLELSGQFGKLTGIEIQRFVRYLRRGIFWNDDPTVLLWTDQRSKQADTWGISWVYDFWQAKKEAKKGKFHSNGDDLLARSHFGDMQFLHAMAEKNCVPAWITQEKIMLWSEFAYKVAIGEIDAETKISDVPIKGISNLFSSDDYYYPRSIYSLFKNTDKDGVKLTALGSLLHMIQDSYFQGHTLRENLSTSNINPIFDKGKIIEFHSYTHQNSGKHKADDEWPILLPKNIFLVRTDNNPSSKGARIIKYAFQNNGKGADWSEVRGYLKKEVFPIVKPESPSWAGERYSDGKLIDCPVSLLDQNLIKTDISLTGGALAQNLYDLYYYLHSIGQLKTREIIFNKKYRYLEEQLKVEGVIPRGYSSTKQLENLLCELNQFKCIFSYGEKITIPDAGLIAVKNTITLNLDSRAEFKAINEKKIKDTLREHNVSLSKKEKLYTKFEKDSVQQRSKIIKIVPVEIESTSYSLTSQIPQNAFENEASEFRKISNKRNFFVTPFESSRYKMELIREEAQIKCDQQDENQYFDFLLDNLSYPDHLMQFDTHVTPVIAVIDAQINESHEEFCQSSNLKNAFSDERCSIPEICQSYSNIGNRDHGTHIAAIIGARKNSCGIIGIHPEVKLKAFYLHSANGNSQRKLVHQIIESFTKKIRVANMSYSYKYTKTQKPRVGDLASEKMYYNPHFLFVVAAGNSPKESYPGIEISEQRCLMLPVCDYNFENVITVAALNSGGYDLSTHSKRGKNVVHIAAPGERISSATNGGYGCASGTSQAAAFVSGTAALLFDKYHDYSPSHIKKRILYTVDFMDSLDNKVNMGKLNVQRAYEYADKDVLSIFKEQFVGELLLRRGNDSLMVYQKINGKEKDLEIEIDEIRRIHKTSYDDLYSEDSIQPDTWTIITSERNYDKGAYELKKIPNLTFSERGTAGLVQKPQYLTFLIDLTDEERKISFDQIEELIIKMKD